MNNILYVYQLFRTYDPSAMGVLNGLITLGSTFDDSTCTRIVEAGANDVPSTNVVTVDD